LVPVIVALATFVITAAVTYSQDLLTPLGNAAAAGAAAVATGALTYLFSPSRARPAAGVILLLALGCLAFAWSEMRDEAPRGIASFVGGCDPFTVHAQNRWDPLGAAVSLALSRRAVVAGS